MSDEVTTLVHRGAEPGELAIIEHGIEEHDALDHASLSGGLPEAVIGLADGRPERLVVDVKHPTTMELARADRRRESPPDQGLQEVRALLPVDDAGEAAVLAFDKDARVQEHVQQEPRLTFGEAERRDGFHPLGIGEVDCPAVGFRRQHHRINSSMIRGCAVRRPPRPPTEPPIER
jgi:hypothetical protein